MKHEKENKKIKRKLQSGIRQEKEKNQLTTKTERTKK
jgi:hypothetical protein